MAAPKHVVIVGGGIAGLSAAFALTEQAELRGEPLHCTVVEGDSRCGGKILTTHTNGLVVEGGPDSFLTTKPAALELCDKLGLTSQLKERRPWQGFSVGVSDPRPSNASLNPWWPGFMPVTRMS